MVENRSVVEQAHEIQCIAKELELLKCALPGKFVAGCIIAKLPQSWRSVSTNLKHQRQEMTVESLIGFMDLEKKAKVKDAHPKGVEAAQSSANVVQKLRSFRLPTSRRIIRRTRRMIPVLCATRLDIGLQTASSAKGGRITMD